MSLKTLSISLSFLLCTLCSMGQSLESLRSEIAKANEEISLANDLLAKTKKNKTLTQSQLKLIQTRIRNRQNIVNKLESQISLINNDIASKNNSISQLELNLAQLQREYAVMVYDAYKNYKLNNFMVFLFSSEDFNDVTRRIAYMRRYNRMRAKKGEQISALKQNLNREVVNLDEKKSDLNRVRSTRNTELNSLSKDETEYKGSVKQLTSEANKLTKNIKEKQSKVSKLQSQIQRIIAEESRKNKNTKRSAAEEEYIANLSGRFDQNMGNLPYPVRGGVIIDPYGLHAHPTQKGLTVDNKGVNIAAAKRSPVRAVFEGEVTRIFFFQGLNNSVMIRHGNYITVYSNLESVAVKNGEKVAINQTLGTLAVNGEEDESVLHFEIWKETQNLNPSKWIRR